MRIFMAHTERVLAVLIVWFVVVFTPSLAFGQALDAEGLDLLGQLLATAGQDATSPMAAGAALFFVVYMATRAPVTSKLIGDRFLTTDARKRAFSLVVALVPGVATVLTGHMSWGKALATALLSWAVAQAIFFLSKKPAAAAPMLVLFLGLPTAAIGCTPRDVDRIQSAAEAARDVAVIAEPCFVDARDRMLAACEGSAKCEAEVRKGYEPIADAFDAFHAAWCALSPDSEGCP